MARESAWEQAQNTTRDLENEIHFQRQTFDFCARSPVTYNRKIA